MQREVPLSNKQISRVDLNEGRRSKTVAKTNQVWIESLKFKEKETYTKISENPLDFVLNELKDPYSYSVAHPVVHKVTKRLELALGLRISPRFASSKYQVTNYGLGGLVVSHMDPYGYVQGMELVEDRDYLVGMGDVTATFMAWLSDTPAGGHTAFVWPGFEDSIEPRKGSAAFWINLTKSSMKDNAASHGGCPILYGSKWILNKWIYSYDNWDKIPCGLEKLDPGWPNLKQLKQRYSTS